MKFKIEDGSIIDRDGLLNLFPSYQIAEELTSADAEFLGIELVHENPPAVSATEVATEDGTEVINGELHVKWKVIPLPDADRLKVIADLKSAKNSQINAWRASANASTFPHLGHLISCDALSRGDIEGVAMTITITGAFPQNFSGVWKTADNAYIAMETPDDFRSMYASMAAQGVANFAKSEALKTLLASATTAEEISSITWE